MGGPSPAVRLPTALVLFALGAFLGVCTVAVHARWWGLALGLAATAAAMVAVPGGWWSRLASCLGWVVALALLTQQRAEGDYVVAQNGPGYVLLGAGVAVLLAGLVGIRPRPERPAAQDRSESGRTGSVGSRP